MSILEAIPTSIFSVIWFVSLDPLLVSQGFLSGLLGFRLHLKEKKCRLRCPKSDF